MSLQGYLLKMFPSCLEFELSTFKHLGTLLSSRRNWSYSFSLTFFLLRINNNYRFLDHEIFETQHYPNYLVKLTLQPLNLQTLSLLE